MLSRHIYVVLYVISHIDNKLRADANSVSTPTPVMSGVISAPRTGNGGDRTDYYLTSESDSSQMDSSTRMLEIPNPLEVTFVERTISLALDMQDQPPVEEQISGPTITLIIVIIALLAAFGTVVVCVLRDRLNCNYRKKQKQIARSLLVLNSRRVSLQGSIRSAIVNGDVSYIANGMASYDPVSESEASFESVSIQSSASDGNNTSKPAN